VVKFNKNIFGILTTSKDIDKFYNQQKSLCDDIIQKYKFFYVVDLSNFLILKKNEKLKNSKNIKNFVYFKPRNLNELKNFVKTKKFIAFNNLNKSLNYFFIYLIISSLKIRLVLSLNLGSINMNLINDFSLQSKIFRFKKKLIDLFFKFLILFKIFPQIDLYLHTDHKLVNKINRINKNKANLPFKKIFNYNYIKKSAIISHRKNNFKIKKKYITFIDQNFYHPDRLLRDKKPSKIEEKNYFSNLNFLFRLLKKKFKRDICICLHPSSNSKLYQKYFSKRVIKKGVSEKILSESLIIFAHISSLIINAINLSKPIMILKSDNLGVWMNIKCDEYISIFNLESLNIDHDKIFLKEKINNLKIQNLITIKKKLKTKSNADIIKEMENLD
tara:strand:+ start:2004 stop:3164 length:1161 start_codon:yes stop_codon:yes gene_type:complete